MTCTLTIHQTHSSESLHSQLAVKELGTELLLVWSGTRLQSLQQLSFAAAFWARWWHFSMRAKMWINSCHTIAFARAAFAALSSSAMAAARDVLYVYYTGLVHAQRAMTPKTRSDSRGKNPNLRTQSLHFVVIIAPFGVFQHGGEYIVFRQIIEGETDRSM